MGKRERSRESETERVRERVSETERVRERVSAEIERMRQKEKRREER